MQLFIDNIEIPITKVKFSDGSSNIKLEIPEGLQPKNFCNISIDPTLPADEYLWQSCLIDSAVAEAFPDLGLSALSLNYLPHARADRVFEKGNAHPLDKYFEILSGFKNLKRIMLIDPHSDYYKKWDNRFEFSVLSQRKCFEITLHKHSINKNAVFVFPDKGAFLKADEFKKHYPFQDMIFANKVRDKSTGKILSTELNTDVDLKNSVCYIIDDICDGGGTFIPLAKLLKERGAKTVNLYVTHGIFARGLDIFKEYIDNIYCYQIVGQYVTLKDINDYSKSKLIIGE